MTVSIINEPKAKAIKARMSLMHKKRLAALYKRGTTTTHTRLSTTEADKKQFLAFLKRQTPSSSSSSVLQDDDDAWTRFPIQNKYNMRSFASLRGHSLDFMRRASSPRPITPRSTEADKKQFLAFLSRQQAVLSSKDNDDDAWTRFPIQNKDNLQSFGNLRGHSFDIMSMMARRNTSSSSSFSLPAPTSLNSSNMNSMDGSTNLACMNHFLGGMSGASVLETIKEEEDE